MNAFYGMEEDTYCDMLKGAYINPNLIEDLAAEARVYELINKDLLGNYEFRELIDDLMNKYLMVVSFMAGYAGVTTEQTAQLMDRGELKTGYLCRNIYLQLGMIDRYFREQRTEGLRLKPIESQDGLPFPEDQIEVPF